MSYQQDIRRVLDTLSRQHGYPATFDVTVARPGSFEMKVRLQGPVPAQEHIFDLSGGLTPRVQRSIAEWFTSVLPKVPEAKVKEILLVNSLQEVFMMHWNYLVNCQVEWVCRASLVIVVLETVVSVAMLTARRSVPVLALALLPYLSHRQQ